MADSDLTIVALHHFGSLTMIAFTSVDHALPAAGSTVPGFYLLQNSEIPVDQVGAWRYQTGRYPANVKSFH